MVLIWTTVVRVMAVGKGMSDVFLWIVSIGRGKQMCMRETKKQREARETVVQPKRRVINQKEKESQQCVLKGFFVFLCKSHLGEIESQRKDLRLSWISSS